MKSLVTKRDKGQSEKIQLPPRKHRRYTGKYNPASICFQNAMYAFDISHFANKWKRDCIFMCIVDVFVVGVTKFFHFGLYRVLWPNSSNLICLVYFSTRKMNTIFQHFARLRNTQWSLDVMYRNSTNNVLVLCLAKWQFSENTCSLKNFYNFRNKRLIMFFSVFAYVYT